jgi:ABC-2 type transport system permease protein
MFPLEFAPQPMQWLALALPTGWAMNAYHRLMFDAAGVAAVLPNVLILVGFAAVFFLIGVRSLRWE